MADLLEQEFILELIPTISKIRYAELASTTIILFDHVLTIDQEVRLIWHSQWSTGKVLFLLNRYYALVIVVYNNYALFNTDNLADTTAISCVHWFRWQGSTGVLMFIIAEFILQLRLYALYFGNKRVLLAMAAVSVGAALGSAYVMGAALKKITAFAVRLPLSGSTVCVPFGLPEDFYAFWIPMLISESLMCGLALYKGIQTYRPGGATILSGKRIVEILVRDSLWYFIIIFCTYLTNAIIFLTRPGSEVEIPIGFAVALSCVMSNRLCLNVRGFILDEPEDHMASAMHPPPRSAFVSFNHNDPSLYADNQSTSVVYEGGTLTALEMRQLRTMRAQAPKQVGLQSRDKKTSLEEIVHIQ